MQIPDGRWRVEVVRRDASRSYRIVDDENSIDWLSLADIGHILATAGVDVTLLCDVDPAA